MASKLTQTDSAEANLVTLSQQGDRKAFEKLIIQYQNWTFNHFYRWIGDTNIAEELAQETFLKAFSKLSSFRQEAKFSTWLFTIMRNLNSDYWRKKENHQKLSQSLEEINRGAIFHPNIDERLGTLKRQTELRLRVAKLPQSYREILMLRYFSEMSYEEISNLLNLKTSRLKMRVARGLELLRKKMIG